MTTVSRPVPPQSEASRVPAVGIDLGTTYSVIAYLDPQGRPASIPNTEGDLLTRSVVLLGDDGVVVGKQAIAAASLEPEKVVDCVTLVEMADQSFKALATDGDVLLGGKDWDEKLVEIAAERLKDQLGEDPRHDPAPPEAKKTARRASP